MHRPNWAPHEVDITQPSAARVYDYYLGGSHNFAIDREMAKKVLEVYPEISERAQQSRAFLRRAVTYMVEQGVTQFIDIGSGIPTVGNTHEIALAAHPQARVVYVDTDPVAVAHSRAILGDNSQAVIVKEDIRYPAELMADPTVNALLDLSKPVGILIILVVHFLSDEQNPYGIVAALRDRISPGSFIAISSGSIDSDEERLQQIMKIYADSPNPLYFRTGSQLARFFDGLELVAPGMVRIPLWRPASVDEPGPEADEYPGYAGVGRKA